MKSKRDYLQQFRTSCLTLQSLSEKLKSIEEGLTGAELYNCQSAADHCRAEIITGRFFDRVPLDVWKKLALEPIESATK